jgi:hypothetical protein
VDEVCSLPVDAPDGKAGTLLTNHTDAMAAYRECRRNYAGLVAWSQDAVARCAKPATGDIPARRWWQFGQ